MKTWKKPEVLNLMLQETKDGTSTIIYDDHICKQTGEKCENNNDPEPDTCGKGHGSLVYGDTTDQHGNPAKYLVTCCS